MDLERSATASTRVSGHIVQGHVDTAVTIVRKEKDGKDCLAVELEIPEDREDLMRFVVLKGYVAVDGASLTVTKVDRASRRFAFMLIPHTQESVVIPRKEVGQRCNLEVDCLAKYAAASSERPAPGPSPSASFASGLALTSLAISSVALAVSVITAWRASRAP